MRHLILPILFIGLTSCNLLTQSKSEPVTVIVPASKPSNFETTDSSFLKLKIKEDKFEIEFLKKTSVADNVNSLDSFFQKNIALINREKVIITGLDTPKKNKNFEDLLTKYGISSAIINTEVNH